jgi:hypothetical protein
VKAEIKFQAPAGFLARGYLKCPGIEGDLLSRFYPYLILKYGITVSLSYAQGNSKHQLYLNLILDPFRSMNQSTVVNLFRYLSLNFHLFLIILFFFGKVNIFSHIH